MDKYRLRRAILSAIEANEPGLCDLATVATYPLLKMGGITAEKIATECQALAQHGYLADLRPGRDPLLRLTAEGRDQLNQETDLDEYIWGEMASKFKS
jgi:hypothetical protein